MGAEMSIYICNNIGVAGTTLCHIQQTEEGFEARIGIALMGMSNLDEDGFKKCDYNPFHDKFYDNYCVGKGKTEEEAIEALKVDMKDMADSLWAV